MNINKPLTLLVILFAFLGWLMFYLSIQPFAHLIETCSPSLIFLGAYAIFHPVLNDLIPSEIQEHPVWTKILTAFKDFLTKPFTIPSWLAIPIFILILCSFQNIWMFLQPHLIYKNPTVIVYTTNWKEDRQNLLGTVNKNPFLQLVEPLKSELHSTETLKLTPPKEFNAIFCTPSSELSAKKLAIDLAKQGFIIHYMGGITNPSNKDKAEIQIGRSYLPLLRKNNRALSPEEIKKASCSS